MKANRCTSIISSLPNASPPKTDTLEPSRLSAQAKLPAREQISAWFERWQNGLTRGMLSCSPPSERIVRGVEALFAVGKRYPAP